MSSSDNKVNLIIIFIRRAIKMAVIDNSILAENDTLSFGNYTVNEKQKIKDFKLNGDTYNMKTHKEVTKLEKNGKLLIETVPGSAIHNLKVTEKETVFSIEGFEDTQITLELESGENYKILVDDVVIGMVKTNMSGKINFSIGLTNSPQNIKIEKNN